MSFANKYYTWLHECTQIINKKKKEEMRKKILTALVVLDSQKKKKKYRQKRYWVEPIFQQRSIHGFYHALFPTIALEESRFRNYIGENQYITETMIDHDGPTGFSPGTWREHINDSALQDINRCGTNNSSRNAMAIRNEFCKYFNSEGAVPWQFNHC